MSAEWVQGPLAMVDNQAINVATMADLVRRLMDFCRRGEGFTLFTLNLDHLVKRHRDLAFRAAYARATLVSADGWPVAAAARRQGARIERVTGADMVLPVCEAAAREQVPIYLFGSSAESLAAAVTDLMRRFPTLDIRGAEAPPMGFAPTSPEARAMAERIAASGAKLCFVALGAPKQELFADAMASQFPGIGFLCIGAALDFISGHARRAPLLMQTLGAEWAWRLLSEPRRLGRRYGECAMFFGRMLAGRSATSRSAHEIISAKPAVPYRLCLMHPMDPRGAKLGGIETHVRQIVANHPADFSVLFVGVDEIGDRTLGVAAPITVGGRTIDFLPVTRIGVDAINLPGKSLTQSTTFRFACGIVRYFLAVRTAAGPKTSADLQRFEFAGLARLLGLPAVQMVHGEGAKNQTMDSLIKRFWFLHRANEWLAFRLAARVLCVNSTIVNRMERIFPAAAKRAEVMTVSVDTAVFAPQPMPAWDGTFRILFAGRLDSFKDPPLMFRVLAGLHERLGGGVEFHYVGTTDPHRYPEFEAIAPFTVRHGYRAAPQVAQLAARSHAGILTSFFEGMPCYLLEMLSVGRPFAAIRLPQYDPLIVPGISGALVERSEPDEACLAALIDQLAALRNAVAVGCVDPASVHALVEPYSVTVQMERLFAHHRVLQSLPAPIGHADVGWVAPSVLEGR